MPSYDINRIYGHTDKFPFGKWKDKSLGYVLERDPDYFIYLEKRFSEFKITKGIMESAYILTGRETITE